MMFWVYSVIFPCLIGCMRFNKIIFMYHCNCSIIYDCIGAKDCY